MRSLAWYVNKGAVGKSLDDCHRNYVKTKSGGAVGSTRDLERAMLSALAFTHPDLDFAWKQFYASKTGLSVSLDYDTLEGSFYANNTFDFI